MRVKIVKPHKYYRAGDILVLDRKTASALIKSGIAILSKDMTASDYKLT